MLVFPITLTQKRVRSPVWIILVLHAELASVRALLVKGLDHSNLPSTLELVCDVPSLLHAHTNKIQQMQIQILKNTLDGTRSHTRNTQTPTQKHMHTSHRQRPSAAFFFIRTVTPGPGEIHRRRCSPIDGVTGVNNCAPGVI